MMGTVVIAARHSRGTIRILEPEKINYTNEISNNVVGVTSKGSDQPARMHRLIRAFASHLNILWL